MRGNPPITWARGEYARAEALVPTRELELPGYRRSEQERDGFVVGIEPEEGRDLV